MRNKVFISGPLTCLVDPESMKARYEELGRICARQGFEAYIPHMYTDPIKDADVTAQDVYATDRYHVSTSRYVIAYAGMPSIGVGQEIQIAEQYGVDVALLYERGWPVSRMARGSPNIIRQFSFDDFGELLEEIERFLAKCRAREA